MTEVAGFLRRHSRAVLISVLGVNLALAAAEWLAPSVHNSIEPAEIHHVQGHAYGVSVVGRWPMLDWKFPFEIRTDNSKTPTASNLIITENWSALGPAHALKDIVIQNGKGSYRHWQNSLLFSTPNNSDPRTNGHTYSVSSVTHVKSIIVSLVSSITLLVLGYLAAAKARSAGLSGEHMARIGCFLGILIVHALFAVLWFARPSYMGINPDTWGYLKPALSAISNGPFIQVNGRTLGYPIFLYGVLLFFESIQAIAAVQFMLFLGISLVFIFCWRVIQRTNNGEHQIMSHSLLLFALSILILNSFFHAYIQFILPEILYAFVAIFCVLIVLCLFFINLSPWLFSLAFIGASFFSSFNFLVKPHWGGTMLYLFVLLLLRLFTARQLSLVLRVALPIVSCAIILFTLIIPQQRLSQTYDEFASATFGAKALFCNNADLVVGFMESPDYQIEHGDVVLVEYVKDFLDGVVSNRVIGNGEWRPIWKRLGFNGDNCMYNTSLSNAVRNHFAHDPFRIRAFYLDHFMDAVINDPLHFASRVIAQLLKASVTPIKEIGRSTSIDSKVIRDRLGVYSLFDELLHTKYVIDGRIGSVFNDYFVSIAPALNFLIFLFNPLALIAWLGIAIIVTAQILSTKRLEADAISRYLPCLLISGAYFSSLIVVAIAHTFDFTRYSQVLVPLAILSVFSCGYALLGLVMQKNRRSTPK